MSMQPNTPQTSLEVTKAMNDAFGGTRFVELQILQGDPPTYVLVFENSEEAKATISFSAKLQVNSLGGSAQIVGMLNILATFWAK